MSNDIGFSYTLLSNPHENYFLIFFKFHCVDSHFGLKKNGKIRPIKSNPPISPYYPWN